MKPADRAGGDLGGVLQLVTAIGSPLALGTALLFYFGWRRSEAQAEALGFDVSVLGMSPQDFMLRSIPVLFFPVALVLVASLGAVWVHTRLMGRVGGAGGDGVLGIARALRWSWAALPALGVALLVVTPPFGNLVLPLLVTLGVIGGIYGAMLRRRVSQDPARTPSPVALLAAALVAVLLFWQTERLARVVGEGLAEQVGADVGRLTAVTVYSPKRLQLGPEIAETRFPMPSPPTGTGTAGSACSTTPTTSTSSSPTPWTRERARLIVLRDDGATRVEFSR